MAYKTLPSIQSLQSFVAIANLGSIAQASKFIHRTPSAVSKQLSALEEYMGADLVDRSTTGVSLTYNGRQLFAVAEDLINDLTHSIDKIKAKEETTEKAQINITLLPSFAARWLCAHLYKFKELHPDITIDLSTSLHPVDLHTEDFHMAIRYGDGQWKGLEVKPFLTQQLIPVVPPNHPLLSAPFNKQSLYDYPLLHDCNRSDWINWFCQNGLDSKKADAGEIFDDYNIVLQSTMDGRGIALGRKPIIHYDLKAGRLVPLCEECIEGSMRYYLVYPKVKEKTEGLTEFIEWLINLAKTEGYYSKEYSPLP